MSEQGLHTIYKKGWACSQGVRSCWGNPGFPKTFTSGHTIQMCALSPSYSLSPKAFSILGLFKGLFWDHHLEKTYKMGDLPVDGIDRQTDWGMDCCQLKARSSLAVAEHQQSVVSEKNEVSPDLTSLLMLCWWRPCHNFKILLHKNRTSHVLL